MTDEQTPPRPDRLPVEVLIWGALKQRVQPRTTPLTDEELTSLATDLALLVHESAVPRIDPQTPGTITGYRTQDQLSVDTVNAIKVTENGLGDLVEALREACANGELSVDLDMLSYSVRQLQAGYMWLVRSIFQPESRLKP